MTREQATMAAGVRDELLLMYQDASGIVERLLVLRNLVAQYGLPTIDAAAGAALGPAVTGLSVAHDAYAEFSAALSVQTGDAGAGASAPAPAEPLKVAA